jgi:KUP system potassium uptake protein
MIGCLLLVAGFRSSNALGAAYGVAVTGTMAITTVLFYVMARHGWHWPLWQTGGVAGAFLSMELALFAANIVKLEHGGWVPLAMAGAVFFVMATWRRGTRLVRHRLAQLSIPLPRFLDHVEQSRPFRVPGTAVFLTPDVASTPASLVLQVRHNHVLHQEVILLAIVTEEVPEIPEEKRVASQRLPEGFWRVQASYGFMQRPDVPRVVALCCEHGMRAEPSQTSYVIGRARLLPTGPAPMMRWRKRLFAFMAWNASSATDFFGLPPDRVIDLGARLEF